MKVRAFDSSLRKFYSTLDESTIAKVLNTVDWLERFGNNLGMPHSKKITKNLFELRTRGRPEVRILYTFKKSEAILLHGFIKKSQKIPRKEISISLNKLIILDSL